jgi:glycine/D-amino acid oxidase-like deaminating enzyme
MEVDYLIIGQGICGTLLSYFLCKEGKTVIVIDDANPGSSSRVAGGIINPVTGKRMVKTWMIDELLPFARDTYKELERELNMPLVKGYTILDFHATVEERKMFTDKLPEEKEYLHEVSNDSEWEKHFRFNYGIGEVSPCLLLDVRAMLGAWRTRLKGMYALHEDRFGWEDCVVRQDHVVYKNIKAHKIVCCDGAACVDSPYFSLLPWSKDKGEALIVSIPGLQRGHIYKQGISIVPWQDDLFWIGATHDWKYSDLDITPSFRKKVEEQLEYWLKLPYTIVDHIVM